MSTSDGSLLGQALKEAKETLKHYRQNPHLATPEVLARAQQEVEEIMRVIREARDLLPRRKLQQAKDEQEAHEARIAALNSTEPGKKLSDDLIRKVSEYGGRKKRKTRKGKKTRRGTRRA